MAASARETTLDAGERQTIEAQCSRLIAAFAYLVDSRRYAELVDLFAPDGSFLRPEIKAEGSAAIAQLMHGRPTTVVTRHICGTPYFESVGAETASAVTYVTVFQVEGTDGEVAEVSGPAGIAEYHDDFILTPGGWKIASRVARPVFIVKR